MKGSIKGKLQSGSYGAKHPMPDKTSGPVGPGARGATQREGNTESPPSHAGNPVVGTGSMAGKNPGNHASGGKKGPGVNYGHRKSY